MKKHQQSQTSSHPLQSAKPIKKSKANPPSTKSTKSSAQTVSQPLQLTKKQSSNDVFAVSFDSDGFDDSDSDNAQFVQLKSSSSASSPSPNSLNDKVSEAFSDLTDSREFREMKEQLSNMQRLHEYEKNELEVSIAQKRKKPPQYSQSTTLALNSLNHIPEGLLKDEKELTYAGLYGEEEDPHELPLPAVAPNTFNPFYEVYKIWMAQAPNDMERIFDPLLPDSRRKQLIDHLPTISQRQYSWAIPTNEVIKVMYHFGPVVEIGAGKGYWGYLLRKYAHSLHESNGESKTTDPDAIYVGFDCCPAPVEGESASELNQKHRMKLAEDKLTGNSIPTTAQKKKKSRLLASVSHEEPMKFITDKQFPSWTRIDVGDSNELKRAEYSNHTLFLCYPDDYIFSEASLAYDCLKKFKGEYIITVGEWLGETRQENPWGRSADGEFQQHLCDQFHKLCHITLPSWHSSLDHFCVWKRTVKCAIDKSDNDEGVIFRYIPEEEKLMFRAIAPCLQDIISPLAQDDDMLINPLKFNKKVGKNVKNAQSTSIGPQEPPQLIPAQPQSQTTPKSTSALKLKNAIPPSTAPAALKANFANHPSKVTASATSGKTLKKLIKKTPQ